jgi:hypothetical protein
MDEEYVPEITKCTQCEDYTQKLTVYENNLKMQTIQVEIRKFANNNKVKKCSI